MIAHGAGGGSGARCPCHFFALGGTPPPDHDPANHPKFAPENALRRSRGIGPHLAFHRYRCSWPPSVGDLRTEWMEGGRHGSQEEVEQPRLDQTEDREDREPP